MEEQTTLMGSAYDVVVHPHSTIVVWDMDHATCQPVNHDTLHVAREYAASVSQRARVSVYIKNQHGQAVEHFRGGKSVAFEEE